MNTRFEYPLLKLSAYDVDIFPGMSNLPDEAFIIWINLKT